jgi:ATP-dependent protease ClpP protease subunit
MPDKRPWYRVAVAKAGGVKRATVHIYDEIDSWFGVSANDLIAEMEALDDVDELDIRINSPGGSAFDGINIANAVMRHPAKTTTYVDGLAASAASLIMVAGDEVVVSKYGQAMLHNAHAVVVGTAKDMREVAGQLDKLNAAMAQLYADRAGGEAAGWVKAMNAETWYDADELVAAGLASRVDDSTVREEVEKAVASALACSSTQFKFLGRKSAPAPTVGASSTGARASVTNHPTKEGAVPLSEKVAERLGLPVDATEDDVLAKLDELDESADDDTDTDAGAADSGGDHAGAAGGDSGKVGELAAAAASAGLVLMDPEKVAKLQSDAALGALARAEQIAAAHAKVVDDAIGKGKITPVRRDHFLTLMAADEQGTTELLAGIPPETAVPMTEIGHSLDPQASADTNVLDDPKFKNWSI